MNLQLLGQMIMAAVTSVLAMFGLHHPASVATNPTAPNSTPPTVSVVPPQNVTPGLGGLDITITKPTDLSSPGMSVVQRVETQTGHEIPADDQTLNLPNPTNSSSITQKITTEQSNDGTSQKVEIQRDVTQNNSVSTNITPTQNSFQVQSDRGTVNISDPGFQTQIQQNSQIHSTVSSSSSVHFNTGN